MSLSVGFHAVSYSDQPKQLRARVSGWPVGTTGHTKTPYASIELGTRYSHDHRAQEGVCLFLSLDNLRHLVTVLREAEARLSVASEHFEMEWSEAPAAEEVSV